jgi:hypothetical protein
MKFQFSGLAVLKVKDVCTFQHALSHTLQCHCVWCQKPQTYLPDQNILKFHPVFLCVAAGQLQWCLVIGPHTLVHDLSFQDTALQGDDGGDQVDRSGKHLDLIDPSGASIANAVRTAETVRYSLQQKTYCFAKIMMEIIYVNEDRMKGVGDKFLNVTQTVKMPIST